MDTDKIITKNTDTNWKKCLPVLWLAVFLCCASYTMCIPFLPVFLLRELYVAQEDVNTLSGIAYAITFLGSAIMAPYWGALADHVGQRKMALRAGLGLAITYFFTGACQDVYQLVIVRAICGIIAGFVPACLSMASSCLPESSMGWGMGLMQTSLASGTIMDSLMGGYLSSWFGMRASFYVGSVALFIATFLVFFIVRDVGEPKRQANLREVHLWQDLKNALHNKELVYIMFMFFMVQSCVMMIQPLITMYVGQLMGHMDDDTIKMAGVIFSLAGIASIISAPFWGKRGQLHGYMRTFCLVTFTAGFINLFQIFVSSVYQFAAIQFIYGLFLAGAIPNINANLTAITTKEMRGKGFGLVTSAQQFGGVVGPLTGGVLGYVMESRFILVTTGVILMAVAGYSYVTRVKKRQIK